MQPESHRVVGGGQMGPVSRTGRLRQSCVSVRVCLSILVYACACLHCVNTRVIARGCLRVSLFARRTVWLSALSRPCCLHHTPCTYSIGTYSIGTYSIGTYSIGIADAPPAPFYSLHLISLIAHRRLLSETKAPSAASITVILRRAMAVTAPKR